METQTLWGVPVDSRAADIHAVCFLPTQGCASTVVGRRAATAAGERSHTDRVIRKDVTRCVDEVDLEEYPLNVGDAVGVLWL